MCEVPLLVRRPLAPLSRCGLAPPPDNSPGGIVLVAKVMGLKDYAGSVSFVVAVVLFDGVVGLRISGSIGSILLRIILTTVVIAVRVRRQMIKRYAPIKIPTMEISINMVWTMEELKVAVAREAMLENASESKNIAKFN